MKEVKEFFTTISERISNPFWGSFIIAWIYCNWDITVGLIFYNSETIKSTFNVNYLSFITEHSNLKKSLILPILYATGYTLILRYVLNIIVVSTSELFEKFKISILRKIQKNGWVKFESLQKEKELFHNYRTKLSSLFSEDLTVSERFQQLEDELRKSEERVITLERMEKDSVAKKHEFVEDITTLNDEFKKINDGYLKFINYIEDTNFQDILRAHNENLLNELNDVKNLSIKKKEFKNAHQKIIHINSKYDPWNV